jgi:hypothetical protein
VNQTPDELTGVNQTQNDPTGVNQTPNEPTDNEETPGLDDHTDLESYMNWLEAELNEEIVESDAIDSDYNPNTDPETSDIELDTTLDTIADYEAGAIRADANREQTSADDDMNHASDDGDN